MHYGLLKLNVPGVLHQPLLGLYQALFRLSLFLLIFVIINNDQNKKKKAQPKKRLIIQRWKYLLSLVFSIRAFFQPFYFPFLIDRRILRFVQPLRFHIPHPSIIPLSLKTYFHLWHNQLLLLLSLFFFLFW